MQVQIGLSLLLFLYGQFQLAWALWDSSKEIQANTLPDQPPGRVLSISSLPQTIVAESLTLGMPSSKLFSLPPRNCAQWVYLRLQRAHMAPFMLGELCLAYSRGRGAPPSFPALAG